MCADIWAKGNKIKSSLEETKTGVKSKKLLLVQENLRTLLQRVFEINRRKTENFVPAVLYVLNKD